MPFNALMPLLHHKALCPDEELYLTIHIQRLLQLSKNPRAI